jgi:hypothetical protein
MNCLNSCSENSCSSAGTFPLHQLFSPSQCVEDNMKKFAYVLGTIAAIAVALPTIASAQTVVIKRGGHHHGWYGARAQMYHHDRGWHRGWRHHHRGPTIVIKKRYHHY